MRAMMPHEIDSTCVILGDLIALILQPAIDYYGKICIVLESPHHFASKRGITYTNDWILAYSPKIGRSFQLKVGEYKKLQKTS